MTDFLQRLAAGPLLLDGAMGSLLLAAGLKSGNAPELWNVTRPEVLAGIHRDYLKAGAEVITTNTFGGSPLKLAAQKLSDRCAELNFAAVRLAMTVRAEFPERRIFIAGDIGPSGKFFPPVGKLEKQAAVESFQTQIEIFHAAGVDFILIETMVDLREAEIVVRTARKLTDIPLAVTMTFDKKPRGYFTIMGDKPEDAVGRLVDAGADVVGANCTLSAEEMPELASILVEASSVPVLMQPNAGQPEMVDGMVTYRLTPEEFTEQLQLILSTGVSAVGGCCGTTPAHVRAVAEKMFHETVDPKI